MPWILYVAFLYFGGIGDQELWVSIDFDKET